MVIKLQGLIPFGKSFVSEDDGMPAKDGDRMAPNDVPNDDPSRADMSSRASLKKISEMCSELYETMMDDSTYEQWVDEKIKEARDLLNSVHGHVTFEYKKADSLPQVDNPRNERMY
ncbi:MAG: hypothetical protein VW683_00460 [Betaproteobacteria bacterium]|jgi:hypothetical protein